MPEMQNVYYRNLFVESVIDQKRRYRHFADSAPSVVKRKTFRHEPRLNAWARSFSPSRLAAWGLSSATNSTISLRSATALSAIRTLKSIAGSSLSLPQRDVPARLRHLSSRDPTRLPAQHCLVRRLWQTTRR